MSRCGRLLLIAVCALGVVTQPVRLTLAQERYTLVDLGVTAFNDPNNPCASVAAGAEAISPTGMVVGQRVVSEDRIVPAATDGASDAWERLKATAKGGSALDANSAGLIVGFTNVSTGDEAPCAYYRLSTLPAAWENGERVELSTGARKFGRAEAVNDDGVIVGALVDDPFASRQPAVWMDKRVEELPLAPGHSEGYATGINGDGVIVGVSTGFDEVGFPKDLAVVWRDGELTALAIGDANGAAALAINESGAVAGVIYAQDESGAFTTTPAVWSADTPEMYPALEGASATVPYAINADGDLAGLAAMSDGSLVAVVWLDGEISTVNDLVPAADGWTFRAAKDIGDDGTIVGWGEVDGEFHGYILRPAA